MGIVQRLGLWSYTPAIKVQILIPIPYLWGVSSVGRTLPLQGRGHRFDPDTLHHKFVHMLKFYIYDLGWCLVSHEQSLSGEQVESSALQRGSLYILLYFGCLIR